MLKYYLKSIMRAHGDIHEQHYWSMWDTDENHTRKETKWVMGLRERETRSRGGSMKVSRDLRCGCGVEVLIW